MNILILIFGLPGTGKTTFARALAHELKAQHLNSDIIRGALGKKGQYDEFTKGSVYEEMLSKTGDLLKEGKTVVVDATFYKKDLRDQYVRMAKTFGAKHSWIEVTAGEEVIKKRVETKRPDSEADFAVYQKIKAAFEPLEEKHLILRSDQLSVPEMVTTAIGYLSILGR